MGVPKGKTSKANRRMNRAGRYADNVAPALSLCPQCHAIKQPHKACAVCGYYKGRPVVAKDAKDTEAKEAQAANSAKEAKDAKTTKAATKAAAKAAKAAK